MKALIVHAIMLIVHGYFMHWTFTYYGPITLYSFWQSIKFLTNVSNANMLWFMVPYLWTDLVNFGKKGYSYPPLIDHIYQVMTPVISLVALTYWGMYAIDPRLLFGDRDQNEYNQFLMFYLHGGNLIVMYNHLVIARQLEHFVNPQVPESPFSRRARWLFVYILGYFAIYGLHFAMFGEHVYGFQSMMSPLDLVTFYLFIFVALLPIDLFFGKFVYYQPKLAQKQKQQAKKRI